MVELYQPEFRFLFELILQSYSFNEITFGHVYLHLLNRKTINIAPSACTTNL
jgi:hypothetical protein